MANTFYNPETVAKVGIGLIGPDLVVAKTFNRDYEAEFKGGVGHSVNVRKPITLDANTRALAETAAITVTTATEPAVVAVTLDENIYSAVRLSDEDLSLEIEDFSAQVLAPQASAMARAIEAKAIAELEALAETTTIAWDAANPVNSFVDARKVLRDMGVDLGGVRCVVGTAVSAALLKAKVLQDVSQSGTSGALREATIGRLVGMDVMEVNSVDENGIYLYHRDAFTLVLRAPMVPQGVTFGQSVSANGFAVRYIRDYDATTLADRSILSVFAGTQAMTKRYKPITGAASDVTPAIKVLIDTAPA